MHCLRDVYYQFTFTFCQLFAGNTGLYKETHTNWLTAEQQFIGRYVRINPQDWIQSPCLRVEFLGCDAGKYAFIE